MSEPKIVLSRKGFDSGSGGHYSPLESKTGKYIWFPIPDKKTANHNNAIRYKDVSIKPSYLGGVASTNLADLYQSLFGTQDIILRRKPKSIASICDANLFAHYDPMLGPAPWLSKAQNITIGCGFGQSNTALSHLLNQEVGKGSVFLFFGAFQSIVAGWSGHYIFGWLKVGSFIDSFEQCEQYREVYGLSDHPHLKEEAFRNMGKRPRNRIFLPDGWLFEDEDLRIPGCGYFKTLHKGLRLTQNPLVNMVTWELPDFFYQNLSWGVVRKSWRKMDGGRCTVRTTQGQEMVARMDERAKRWLRELFVSN